MTFKLLLCLGNDSNWCYKHMLFYLYEDAICDYLLLFLNLSYFVNSQTHT